VALNSVAAQAKDLNKVLGALRDTVIEFHREWKEEFERIRAAQGYRPQDNVKETDNGE